MRGSTTGLLFAVHTFGESHGPAVGVVIEGVPPGFPVDLDAVQRCLDRRRPGTNRLHSQRREEDRLTCLSGLSTDGRATGAPLCIVVANTDARPADYRDFASVLRPSHADYTWWRRTTLPPQPGGGRASARETVARVAAGAIAAQVLIAEYGVQVVAWVDQVGPVLAGAVDEENLDAATVDASAVRCPDPAASTAMIAAIDAARADGDSVGGAIRCVARGVPVGWGEPAFDKLTAALGAAILSLPACRGVEFGLGFAAAALRGSAHNDLFVPGDPAALRTATNHSGGIQGGFSNGMPIRIRAAFKPPATIATPQPSVTLDGTSAELRGRGRHDPCVVPRAVPIVEAAVLITLADFALRAKS